MEELTQSFYTNIQYQYFTTIYILQQLFVLYTNLIKNRNIWSSKTLLLRNIPEC